MYIQPTGKRCEILRLERPPVWLLFIAAFFCIVPATIFAQSASNISVYSSPVTPPDPTPTGQFAITGTVIDAVSKEPIRKALVQLNIVPRRTAFTDGSGRFQFEGVLPGSASLTAQKPGYFSQQELSGAGAEPIDVGPNA